MSISLFDTKAQAEAGNTTVFEWAEETNMEPWKGFSARHEHCLAHYLEVLAEVERLGLNTIQACSIVGIGVSPSRL